MKPTNYHSPEHRRQFLEGIQTELDHAYAKHGAREWSRHEFYAILKEEVDEAWDDIKRDAPMETLIKEVMQIAAVCLRFAETAEVYHGLCKLPLPTRNNVKEKCKFPSCDCTSAVCPKEM